MEKSVRDYAVDIGIRFLRFTRHDEKLYSCPDTTLAEQFIEGLGGLIYPKHHAVIGLNKGL